MSYRQPKRLTNEEPHKKLDPREVKARASVRNNRQTEPSSSDWNDDRSSGSFSKEKVYDEDQMTYDEIYDDVRRYSNTDGSDSKGRRFVGKIVLYLQAAVSVMLIVLLLKLNVLPDKIMVIVAATVAVVWLLVFLSQRKKRNKGQIIGMVISILLCFVFSVGSVYLIKTNDFLKAVNRSYDIKTYDVVVLSEDPAREMADTADYVFAVQTSLWKENIESVVSDIEEEIGSRIATVEMNSSLNQAEALLSGEVDAIIYNDAFTSTILEKYEDFETRVRILKTYTVKTASENVRSIDINIKDGAFLVFVSGTDTIGDVSLTGRSDVNLVAGINTKTKEILLITIPRDYYVEFPGITTEGSRDKLTHSGIYGMEELISTVEKLIGYEINYYVRMNFSSLVEIVEALGGVTIYNEQDFTSIDGYFYPKGELYLNGFFTLNYVRERHAFEDGDLARGRHQVQVFQVIMDQLISVNTITNYDALTDAFSKFAVTNIPANDITDIIKLQLQENPQWHLVSYQLLGDILYQPCQSANGAYLSVVMPYKESIDNMEILLDQLFSGEKLSEDLQLEDNGQLTYITEPIS